jgi:hypothetical protein
MKYFEDEVIKFVRPILSGVPASISHKQIEVLAGWICLIVILSEFIDRSLGVSTRERIYLKTKKRPPDNWVIVVAGLYGPRWSHYWTHHARNIFVSDDRHVFFTKTATYLSPNTQITSFGVGKLFVQAISSPHWHILRDFEIAATSRGLTQIWPTPFRFWSLPLRLWPFSERRTQFPPKLTLTDDVADEIAEAFDNRLEIMFGAEVAIGRRYRF